MALSVDAAKRIMHALALKAPGLELASAMDTASAKVAALEAGTAATIALAIVATSVSPTTNFAALAVGDLVAILPAAAGNAQFVTCAVTGTLPQAAVVGSLYVAIRPFVAAAAVTRTDSL